MTDPLPASIDRYLPLEAGPVLEGRFWRPVEDGSPQEASCGVAELLAGVGVA